MQRVDTGFPRPSVAPDPPTPLDVSLTLPPISPFIDAQMIDEC